MFGQSGSTSFGGFNTGTQSTPFSQSAFGKPIATTSFGTGATPVFGTSTSLFNTKPASTTPGGLFGSSTGTSAFGQPATTQSSFGFGGTNTNTNLFGTQQSTNTNLFGTSTATPAFGQTNKPAGFGFGTSTGTSLFGQPQQTSQQTTPFGQTNSSTNTGLFGSTTGFGATNTATGMTGTVVKFSPLTGTDTMMKNGATQTISTRHHCITCMKEYEAKSLEELRLEDYIAGRKGTQTQSTGLFGSPAQPTLFGAATAGTSATAPSFGSTSGGFGATNQPAGAGLFNKPITGFGAPTTTSAFAFNSTTSSNLFGSNTQTKPFGVAAPAPLFSTNNTAPTVGTAFGTTQNTGFGTFGATQANQSIGLFNQNKSSFSLPTSSTSTVFGGFGQPTTTNTGTSLFGVKPAGTTGFGTSTFGATTAPSFGNNLGFGTTQNTNTSLFNNTFKPIGQTSGFSFGTSGASTGLGSNTSLSLTGGSSLFNQQKPGGLFGLNSGTFNNTGFGMSTGFGTTSGTLPSLGMSMLGGVATNPNQQNTGSVPIHQQILALVSAPFGDSPLLKNLLPASGKAEELLKPSNLTNRPVNSSQYKVSTSNSPRIKAKVVTASHLSKKSLFEGLEEEDPSLLEAFQPRPNAKHLILRPKHATNISQSMENMNSTINGTSTPPNGELENINKENQESQSSDNNTKSSTTWLKSSVPQKKSQEEIFSGQQPSFRGSNNPPERNVDNIITDLKTNPGNQSQTSFSPNTSKSGCKNYPDSIERDSDSPEEVDKISRSHIQLGGIAKLAKVKLQRVGYYTIPAIETLDEFVCGETCIVPNFTVGRKGYGNVYFPDSFDIYGLNLDEIVHFRHKEVIIYPDDDRKPSIGQELNRKAQVTLDRVWPQDKSLHEPITDPHRLEEMNYEGKLRRVSVKHNTRFLEYRVETGSWVFKVDHF